MRQRRREIEARVCGSPRNRQQFCVQRQRTAPPTASLSRPQSSATAMSSLSVRSARAAHGSPRDDFAATVARELAAQRPASARPAPRAGERDVERLSMAPVEQYDWEEVANELQAENDRLETALAQTRMRADKKLKQLNVLRDELAEFDAGERERAGGDEWFLAWALPPTVEAALAPHSKAPVAAKKTPVPPPAAAEGAARSCCSTSTSSRRAAARRSRRA